MSPSPKAASWTDQDLKLVAEQLVASNAEFQPLLRDALRPIRARLLGDLERIFADPSATEGQRLSAANAFADFAAGDIAKLSGLLAVATPEQYAVLYPIVAANPAPATIDAARSDRGHAAAIGAGISGARALWPAPRECRGDAAAAGRAREGAAGL